MQLTTMESYTTMQIKCKSSAEQQACLIVMPRCSLSYAKIAQIESRTTSLLECYAEVQPILCKVRKILHTMIILEEVFV